MFKFFAVIPALFVPVALSAQITIHSSDFPNAGDSVLTSVTLTTSNDPTLTGASYNWDYSTLTPAFQRYDKFDSPLTFSSIYSLLFSVFTTSYGQDNYTITSLPLPAVTVDAAYDFYKKSSSDLRQTGSGYAISGTPLPFIYTSPDIQYRFPVTYLDTDSCDYKFGLPIPSVGYYGQTGHRVNYTDGWGTLTTPFGTFSTLRVKSVVTSVDTAYVDAVSFGGNLPAQQRNEYKWFATGMKVPVLEIDGQMIAGNEVITGVTYIDSSRAGVPQVGIAENTNVANFNVFPNPARDKVFINYSLTADAKIKISISNVLGKTVQVIAEENQAAGQRSVIVDVKELNLSPGIYFVTLESNGLREVKKMVVSR
ncbi:MAG: hypothetical protein JWP12_2325 [Bacteroidetes bacterium]|nr:hypothetical protein [Bacteroidota bacterium]